MNELSLQAVFSLIFPIPISGTGHWIILKPRSVDLLLGLDKGEIKNLGCIPNNLLFV